MVTSFLFLFHFSIIILVYWHFTPKIFLCVKSVWSLFKSTEIKMNLLKILKTKMNKTWNYRIKMDILKVSRDPNEPKLKVRLTKIIFKSYYFFTSFLNFTIKFACFFNIYFHLKMGKLEKIDWYLGVGFGVGKHLGLKKKRGFCFFCWILVLDSKFQSWILDLFYWFDLWFHLFVFLI